MPENLGKSHKRCPPKAEVTSSNLVGRANPLGMAGALSDGSNFYFGRTELRQVTDSFFHQRTR
jgi:hypothetical protein